MRLEKQTLVAALAEALDAMAVRRGWFGRKRTDATCPK
jgi:hypothetical protein